MARVDIVMSGRVYPIACDDGQEERVRDIARHVDARLADLKRRAPAATDLHLMVMLSLLLADELFETRAAAGQYGGSMPPAEPGGPAEEDPGLVDAIGRLADQVEAIAARVEQS